MRNQKTNSLLIALFCAAFVIALCVSNTSAQRRFDFKAANVETEAVEIDQFTDALVTFVLKNVELKKATSLPDKVRLRRELQEAGNKVKGNSGNARRLLQNLISKLKNGNRWNDDFDKDFLGGIVSPRIKSLIQGAGARKALSDADAAFNSFNAEIDASVREANDAQGLNQTGDVSFSNASFAFAKNGRGTCALLGIGIALAESRLLKMKLTAQNLDNIFDSRGCGGGAGGAAPTT